MTQTPAGWYPDPSPESADDRGLRYWDGTAWTAHVAPGSAQTMPAGPKTPDGEPLAGWWWRVLAYMIDSFIVSFVVSFASVPGYVQIQRDLQPVLEDFVVEAEQNPEEPPDVMGFYDDSFDAMQSALQANWFWLVVPSVLVITAYWVFFLRWKGATPGKLMLGLRVRLRDKPGTLPWWSIAARIGAQFGIPWVVYAVAYASGSLVVFVVAMLFLLVWLIDPLWATWDPKRQTLHDKAARTNVVKTR